MGSIAWGEKFGSLSGVFIIICGAVFLLLVLFCLFLVHVSAGCLFSPLNTISVIDYHHRMNIHIHPPADLCYTHTLYLFYTYTSIQNRAWLVAIGILGHGESSGLGLFFSPGLFSYLLFCCFPSGSINWGVFIFFIGILCFVIEWGCWLLIIWVSLGDGRGRIRIGGWGEVGGVSCIFFNPAKVPEGYFYYGKAKVNVSIPEDFLALGFGFFLRLWIGYFFPICIRIIRISFRGFLFMTGFL